ncbi:MAG: hypothetical protein EPN47_05715 [Acidobacteria bacterium]|nr:MAG: hypothetical protein EPN47_05715 [Acidobacteriota bacterium]
MYDFTRSVQAGEPSPERGGRRNCFGRRLDAADESLTFCGDRKTLRAGAVFLRGEFAAGLAGIRQRVARPWSKSLLAEPGGTLRVI